MPVSRRARFIGLCALFLVVFVAITLGLVLGLRTPALPDGGSPTYPPPEVDHPDSAERDFRYAAVQTHTNVCSSVGTYILAKHTGNAVDAGIAAILCVGVVNGHSSGIGGGFIMTLNARPRNSTRFEVNTIISREVAALNATEDMFVNDTSSKSEYGGLAIAVPGEMAGLFRAWQLYGSVPWETLLQPTALILEQGFTVERPLAKAIVSKERAIRASPSLSEVFLHKDGRLLKEGDTFIDKTLARTFRTLVADPGSFYNGSLARDIVDDIQDAGGIVTLEDLSLYSPRVRRPVEAFLPHANLTLYTPPSPSSGHILQFALRLLDSFNLSADSVKDDESTILTYHRLAEIFKFAYAKRSALGDEEFVNITEIVANLTSADFIAAIKDLVDDSHTHPVSYYGPSFEFQDAGTAHLTVVAPDGSAVALTSTINLYFGSGVRGKRTGIIFNDEMDDFSTPGTSNNFGLPASPSNFIRPRKTPMSSMAPAIFLDSAQRVVLAIGGSGGTRITSQIVFVAMQHLYLGKDLKTSTDTARIHHQLVPDELQHEAHMDNAIVEGLKAKGHKLSLSSPLGRIGTIAETCVSGCTGSDCFLRKCLTAVSDGRKGGTPEGL